MTARAATRQARKAGERKRDATRRLLLERALELFQRDGVDATTMRDIARAAGLSLGAAYYHFPSKEALVFAYYEANQAVIDDLGARATGSVRDRLGTILHGKLKSVRPHRQMLASIVGHLVNPHDPLSAFSAQTAAVRERAIAVYAGALAGADLPPPLIPLAASAVWMLSLGLLLVYIHDDSRGQARTHRLLDDALGLLVPLLPMLATPFGQSLAARVTGSLARAGIELA